MGQSIRLVIFAVLAVVLTLVPQGVWGALVTVNLRIGIGIPWSAPAIGLLLWAAWRYLGGDGPPARTSQARRCYRRANRVPTNVLVRALLTNALAITSLAGFWIVMFQLVKAPGNALPDFSKYPPLSVGVLLVSGALVGAFSEEVGIQGYLQGRLERSYRAPVAIIVAALALSPGHGITQGFVWSTLLFYFLVDVVYGVTAYLTDSILPGIIAHAVGLLVFFTLIWPNDTSRRLFSNSGADAWFWLHLVQGVFFGCLAVWCFIRLSTLTSQMRMQRTIDAPEAA